MIWLKLAVLFLIVVVVFQGYLIIQGEQIKRRIKDARFENGGKADQAR